MNAARVFARALKKEKTKRVFGVPGEENIDLLEALNKEGIEFIPTRHEQGAAFIADVQGRLTGRAGVCLATLGPGATNLITGVADANLDSAPLVAITGQGEIESMHKESHQYIDVVEMFKPVTKWNTSIKSPNIVPEVVRKAFRIAEAERPGATHIELPEDIAGMKAKENYLKISKWNAPHPDEADIRKTVNIIKNSRHPIIILGHGVIRANATNEFRKFLEKNPIPTANTFMSKGVISSKHPLSIGTIGLQMKDYVMCGIDKADTIIAIGYDLVEYSPIKWNPNNNKKIIHIGALPAETDNNYTPEIEIVGDIKETLSKMAKHKIIQKPWDYHTKLKKLIKEDYIKNKTNNDFPLKPQRVIASMRNALSDSDILISDVGAHKVWIARMFPAHKPNTVIISNGFASMGISLPGAIAAKLSFPEKKVISAVGDGGFLMNVQELETAVRLKLGFTVLIFHDKKYSLIEWKQRSNSLKATGIDFTNPDFVKLAESFGCIGIKISSASQLDEELKKAVKRENEITILDVPINTLENLKLSEKLGTNICPA